MHVFYLILGMPKILPHNCFPMGITACDWTYRFSFHQQPVLPVVKMKSKKTNQLYQSVFKKAILERTFLSGFHVCLQNKNNFQQKCGYAIHLSHFFLSFCRNNQRCFEQCQISCWLLIKSTVQCYYGILANTLSIIIFGPFLHTQKNLICDGGCDNMFSI